MSRKSYDYVSCNGCFKEQRLAERRTGFGTERCLPEGWIETLTADGKHHWDLCESCLREVGAVLFAKERVSRVLAALNPDAAKEGKVTSE